MMAIQTSELSHRIATEADIPALRQLMDRAIAELQTGFLTPAQVDASKLTMGLDSQLIRDATYIIVEADGVIAGCGGWSFRATLYGGDDSIIARAPEVLDPASDAARVRAMYTDPGFARRGIGRMVLSLCEAAARDHGFGRAEMMATLAGEPLYRACGYLPIEAVLSRPINGVAVPLIRMGSPCKGAAMTADIGILAILAAAGFGAGFVDSIAGGGGLLSVPALFAAGIPPVIALGTGKIQSTVGTATATWRYQRAGLIDWAPLVPALACTALGGAIGAWLVQAVGAATLKLIVPFMMLGAIVYFLVSPRMTDADSQAG